MGFALAGLLLSCQSALNYTPIDTKQLFQASGCTNCYDRTRPLVGRSFADIARRYCTNPESEAQLRKSFKHESAGRWGGKVPMPPQPVSEAEAKAMVRWILTDGSAESASPGASPRGRAEDRD